MTRGGFIEVIREDGITRLVNDEELSRHLLIHMECVITRLLLYNNTVHRDNESLVRSLSRDLTKLLIRHGILNPDVVNVKNATARLLFVSDALVILGCKLREGSETLGTAYVLLGESLSDLALGEVDSTASLLYASWLSLRGKLRQADALLTRRLGRSLGSIVETTCSMARISEFFDKTGVYIDSDDVIEERRHGKQRDGNSPRY
jgi:hypothetical protein